MTWLEALTALTVSFGLLAGVTSWCLSTMEDASATRDSRIVGALSLALFVAHVCVGACGGWRDMFTTRTVNSTMTITIGAQLEETK